MISQQRAYLAFLEYESWRLWGEIIDIGMVWASQHDFLWYAQHDLGWGEEAFGLRDKVKRLEDERDR